MYIARVMYASLMHHTQCVIILRVFLSLCSDAGF